MHFYPSFVKNVSWSVLKVFWVLGYIAIHHSTIQLAERESYKPSVEQKQKNDQMEMDDMYISMR